jgi:hypothetical protein
MTPVSRTQAGARPARGALPQTLTSLPRAPVPVGKTSPERPPRGGAGRALAGGAGPVPRGSDAP